MKRVRVTIEIVPNEGNPVSETYEMDPQHFWVNFASDANSGLGLPALAAGMPLEAFLHAHGWLVVRGVVKAMERNR